MLYLNFRIINSLLKGFKLSRILKMLIINSIHKFTNSNIILILIKTDRILINKDLTQIKIINKAAITQIKT